MKIFKIFFAIFVLTISSCAPAYIPNAINAPLLNNKGETQLSFHGGMGGLDEQTSFAVSKNIALMANFNYLNDTKDSDQTYHKHIFGEAGIGYYFKSNSKIHFETFAGFGLGKVDVKTYFWSSEIITKCQNKRIFLQPTVGFSSELVDFSFTPRFVYVIMKPEYLQYSTVNYPFLEPTVAFRLGYKYFFFTSQFGISLPLTKLNNNDWFNYQPIIFSIGITVKLFKIYDTQSMN